MQISLKFNHDNQNIQIDLDTKDTETITSLEWSELYQNAQNCHLPYYWISIAIIKNQNEYVGHCYDGTTLKKCKLSHKNQHSTPFADPLTGMPILKIYNIYLNCFDFSKKYLPPTPLISPTLSSFQLSEIPFELRTFCALGLNGFRAQNQALLKHVGQAQFIIGTHLLNSEDEERRSEAIRWIWSSAQQGIQYAQGILTGFGEFDS